MTFTNVINKLAACFPRKPAAYLFLFVIWMGALWFLSAGNNAPKETFTIPHIDKLYHFLYFFAGGTTLSLFVGLKWPTIDTKRLFIICLVIGSIIGRLDEYHQSFTPGRSGNDTGDWLADTLGGGAGALLGIKLILPTLFTRIKNKPCSVKKSC